MDLNPASALSFISYWSFIHQEIKKSSLFNSVVGSGATSIKNPPRCGGVFQPPLGKSATGDPLPVLSLADSLGNATDSPSFASRSLLNLGSSLNGSPGQLKKARSVLELGAHRHKLVNKVFCCNICFREFQSNRARASHQTFCERKQLQKPGDVFPCDLCERDFNTTHGLRIHRPTRSK